MTTHWLKKGDNSICNQVTVEDYYLQEYEAKELDLNTQWGTCASDGYTQPSTPFTVTDPVTVKTAFGL